MGFALILAASLAAPASSATRPPLDFDAFWSAVRAELAAVPLDAKLEPDAAHTDKDVACFKASYASLGKVAVHARYCRPAREGRFPAVLISPWYAQGTIPPPDSLAKRGIAALWYQARGFDVDQSTYPLANSWYILDGIGKPETYVYRAVVAHALRGVDFLAARPEVDAKRIGAMGASQGGGLSLLAAGLDPRVAAVAADFPFLSDWGESLSAPSSPYADVREYVARHPGERAAVMRTISYFDTLDVAERVVVPVFVEVGLKDRTCPFRGIKTMYERLKSRRKTLKQYPYADHTDRGAERWTAAENFLVEALQRPSR